MAVPCFQGPADPLCLLRRAANAGGRTLCFQWTAGSLRPLQAAANSGGRTLVSRMVPLFCQLAVLVTLALWMPPAWADPAGPTDPVALVEARVGNHLGFGRLVLEFG